MKWGVGAGAGVLVADAADADLGVEVGLRVGDAVGLGVEVGAGGRCRRRHFYAVSIGGDTARLEQQVIICEEVGVKFCLTVGDRRIANRQAQNVCSRSCGQAADQV